MRIHSKEWLGDDAELQSRQSQIIHKFQTTHLVARLSHQIELEGYHE
ncbi:MULTISPECIES: hypothetical protein [unclassified Oleiphilus]|nr:MULTISPECIES: hypothetical protein [unclassified Oleiphilus]